MAECIGDHSLLSSAEVSGLAQPHIHDLIRLHDGHREKFTER